jgi:hypothetical protein
MYSHAITLKFWHLYCLALLVKTENGHSDLTIPYHFSKPLTLFSIVRYKDLNVLTIVITISFPFELHVRNYTC